MDPARTVAYGADQKFGIVKFVNSAAPGVRRLFFQYIQPGHNESGFGQSRLLRHLRRFQWPNPVIYATTMENGTPSYYPGGLGANTAQGIKTTIADQDCRYRREPRQHLRRHDPGYRLQYQRILRRR